MVTGAEHGKTRFATWGTALLLPVVATVLSACQPQSEASAPDVRPVRTVTIERRAVGDAVSLTGHVQAQNEASLAFRISGRMIERPVNVGDRVTPGQVIARLDPQNELNTLRSAKANLAAAEGQLVQARNAYDRQQRLLTNGFTTRAQYDQAQQALQTATSQVDDAEAQLKIAHDNVSFTELKADSAGTITARGAEPGEVVQAGRMIVQVARQDGRDAVFDVPAQVLRAAPSDPVIAIRLTDDPAVAATGRVREVAPQADATTRTFPVRVGLIDPPEGMRLGSTVTGVMQLDTGPVISIPASALTRSNRQPAVWVVDPQNQTVALRNIEVLRFDPGTVVVDHGLDTGDIVVTAGVQALHPGQKVRLLGSAR